MPSVYSAFFFWGVQMEEKQAALWEQVRREGEKLIKEYKSFHIFEQRYMLHNREVAVLYEISNPHAGPIDCYYLDEVVDIRDFFMFKKDKE